MFTALQRGTLTADNVVRFILSVLSALGLITMSKSTANTTTKNTKNTTAKKSTTDRSIGQSVAVDLVEQARVDASHIARFQSGTGIQLNGDDTISTEYMKGKQALKHEVETNRMMRSDIIDIACDQVNNVADRMVHGFKQAQESVTALVSHPCFTIDRVTGKAVLDRSELARKQALAVRKMITRLKDQVSGGKGSDAIKQAQAQRILDSKEALESETKKAKERVLNSVLRAMASAENTVTKHTTAVAVGVLQASTLKGSAGNAKKKSAARKARRAKYNLA